MDATENEWFRMMFALGSKLYRYSHIDGSWALIASLLVSRRT